LTPSKIKKEPFRTPLKPHQTPPEAPGRGL